MHELTLLNDLLKKVRDLKLFYYYARLLFKNQE